MWLDDSFWLRASRFVMSLPASVRYILAPAELNHVRSECVPFSFSYLLNKHDCVIVLPKDDVDLLPLEWIQQRHCWEALYVDEVFAAFRFAGDPRGGAAQSEHLPYLYDRANKVAEGISVRPSRLDTPLSDPIGDGRPYAVMAAASMTGNGGDRLIASAGVRLLKQAWPHLSIVVADGNPDRTLVANASAVVIGPGGMLYDLDRTRIDLMNLANWFRYGHLAAEYEIPLFALGLGHQSMVSELGWDFVTGSLATARFVTTRDRETASLLVRRLKCPVEALPDLSVLFSDEIRAFASGARTADVLTICGDFRHVTSIAECLSPILSRTNFKLRFVVQANEDQEAWEVHGEALEALLPSGIERVDCRDVDPMEFCRAIATSAAVITTRFHGMKVALIAGVDVLTLTNPGDKRERVRDEIGAISWARFRPWTRNFRDLAQDVAEMLAGASPDPSRAVRFDLRRFDSLATMLSSVVTTVGR